MRKLAALALAARLPLPVGFREETSMPWVTSD